MNRFLFSVSAVLSLSLFAIAAPAGAQDAPAAKSFGQLTYDATQETTLNGTVSELLVLPTQGMIAGPHLLLQTPAGIVDASLGRHALRGPGALSVEPGQRVSITGVMRTSAGKPVFLARSVTVNGITYTLRNEHGASLSPQMRERLNEAAAQKGGLQ